MSSLSSLYRSSGGHGPSHSHSLSRNPGLSSASAGAGYGGTTPGYGANTPAFSSSYYSSETSRLLLGSEPSHLLSSEPPRRPYSSSDAIALYGSSSSSYLPSLTPPPSQGYQLPSRNPPSSAASWHPSSALQPADPVLSGLNRPSDEVFYPGDIMSKRARVDTTPSLPIYPQRPGEKDCAFYMRTRTCSFGSTCKYDHPTWVPAGGIPDWKEASGPTSKIESLPVRSGEPDCAFYMNTGICKFGVKCKFNHPKDRSTIEDKKPSNDGAKEASKIAVTATGVNGDAKDVDAPPKPASSFNAKGLPIRPDEAECTFYMKTGSCKFGSTCCFNHPEKKTASVATQSQAVGNSMLGGLSGGLGLSSAYNGAFTDYGLSIPGSGFGVSSLGQAPLYPQRPGEATCSYYMKTGICKFGAGCKFHHPVNRTEPSHSETVVKLTLAGLPRHEGEQSCPFYMKTGTCKFGTSCKFDHPPPGEAAAKALAEAGKSEHNQSNDTNALAGKSEQNHSSDSSDPNP